MRPPHARTSISATALTLCALVVTAMVGSSAGVADAADASTAPTMTNNATSLASATCPDHVTPPPAVDTSEQPAPGQPTPTPLPEPATPVGGPRMGECGVVLPAGAPPAPTDINADSWLLEDLDTGAVLAAKDPHARERPASLIKLLLALVVTRELSPNTMIAATQDDANQPPTRVGIIPDAQYRVGDLIDALLMKSGNDVACALATQLGGFAVTEQKMDALAQQLGALDTRAATPSGLDGPGMSASAYDIAVIFRAAMANQLIATAVQTRSMVLPASNGKSAVTVDNENELLVGGVATARFPGEIGGKTGYTSNAQHTYADAAEQNGHRVALVMMRNPDQLVGVYHDAKELLDYGFQLDAAKLPPVGQVVDANPAAGRAKAVVIGARSRKAPPAPRSVAATTPAPEDPMSPFGTVGMPLTILAGVAALLIVLLVVRRKSLGRKRAARAVAKAKADKAAKEAAQANSTARAAEDSTAPVKDVNWDAVDEAFAQTDQVRPVRRPLRRPGRAITPTSGEARAQQPMTAAEIANATETTEVFRRIQ